MFKINKLSKLSILSLALFSINSFALPTSDIKVSAKILSGCLFSAEDIQFGVLNPNDTSKRTSPATIILQCSKGTQLVLSTDSTTYTGFLQIEKIKLNYSHI